MPIHVMLGPVVLVLAALAAVASLVYAFAIPTRRALRWPLVVLTAATMIAAIVLGESGGALLETVERTGSAAEVQAARAHAHGSDALTTSVFFLLAVVVSTVWRTLSPSRRSWTTSMRIGATLTVITAAAVLVTGGVVLVDALNAVAAGHPSWNGD